MKNITTIVAIEIILCSITLNCVVYAQDGENYFTLREKWANFYSANPYLKSVEDGGYSQFLRWQEFWRTRVNNGSSTQNGIFSIYSDGVKSYYDNKTFFTRASNVFSDWHLLGPKSSAIQNIGQISAVYIDTISDKSLKTIYIGTNSSGIWRTVDGGQNWRNLTDGSSFYINGITDIVGDLNNGNVIYAATGGGFMEDHAYSTGIIKTINAGQTWDQFYPIAASAGKSVNEIIIDPSNTNHIFALVDTTVMRTIDGGLHWWPILKIPRIGPVNYDEKRFCTNIVMKPGDPSVLFVATSNWHWANSHSQEVWKISNALNPDTNLVTRQRIDLTLPNNGQSIHTERFKLAVTPANPNLLYVACNEVSDTIEKLKVWKFTNNLWTKEIDTISISNGTGFFKFEFLVSPTDPDVIYIGGLTMERIVKKSGFWHVMDVTPGEQRYPTYHFDTRDAKILKGSAIGTFGQNDILFAGNDGGISKTSNGIHTWSNLNGNGLSITQFYGIGSANSIPQKIACGSQDNSFFEYDNGTWYDHEPGDWGNIVVDHNSPQFMYGNIWGSGVSAIIRSINGGTNWGGGNADTVRHEPRMINCPIVLNPQNPKTVFFGAANLYKSYNRLDTTAALIKIPVPQKECDTCSSNAIAAFTISPQDTSIIYLVITGSTWQQPKKFFKTNNNGLNWQNLTDNVIIKGISIFDNYFVSDIVIKPTDANTIWMSLTGFYSPWGDSSRVIVSTDGGHTFSNYSKGLPNMPINCIRYMNGTNDRLLVGTDVGVFYMDNSQTEWQPFNTGLPICPISDLEINDNIQEIRAGTFGRGLWETNIACAFESNSPLIIQKNTIWVNDTALNNSVYIDSSFTLTIKSKVLLPPMAKIYVKQGAKLVVDGGWLTNKCYNYWQGIEIWGRYEKPQNTFYQGSVYLKNNAVIENSRIGITTCKKDPNGYFEWNTTGGIIKAENSTFRNNYKAVEFIANLKGQYSSFKKVTFETTPNYLPGSTPSDFVSLLGVRGVQFLGCIFRNVSSPSDTIPKSIAGRGIYSLGSSFTVDRYEYCPSLIVPCPNPQYSTSVFQGLRYGIRALGFDPTYSISVNSTRFEYNYRGVYFGSVNNVVVTKDTFNLRTFYSNPDTLYGLYLGKSSGYKIQENRFHCSGNNLIPNNHVSFLSREFGIVIDSSGSAPNEIYKNLFDSLDVAINAQKLNRAPNDSTGLVIQCNTYNNNSYDEMVTYNVASSTEGIALKQGAKTTDPRDPAGNTFSPYHGSIPANLATGLELDIKNRAHQFRYFHHIQDIVFNAPRVLPTLIDTNMVKRMKTTHIFEYFSCCPSKLIQGGGTAIRDDLAQSLAEQQMKVDSLTTVLLQVVDGGNTDALNTDILFSNSQQSLELREELIQQSPYLSDTVMKSAIEKETVLPNEMIRDIMVANPQFTQSDNVMNELDNRFTPMPDYMLSEILAGTDSLSPKENLDAQLQSEILKRQYTFNELVNFYQNDTVNSSSKDSLLVLLEKEPTLDAQYRLAFEYLGMGNIELMNNILENIPVRFRLTDFQQQQYEDYVNYLAFLQSMNEQNRTVFQLNDEDRIELQNFKTNATDPVSTYSQNILEANEMLIFNEPVLIPDNTKSIETGKTHKSRQYFTEHFIKVFPNPSTSFIIVEYHSNGLQRPGEQVQISIIALDGKQIASRVSNKAQEQLMIDTRFFNPGVYICKLSIGAKILESTEFTVIH